MVVFSELPSLFVTISIRDALSSHDLFNDISESVMPWLKELEQLKLMKYKSAAAGKFITKKQVSSVECWDHCDEIKTIS